jgi:hypothetical protein
VIVGEEEAIRLVDLQRFQDGLAPEDGGMGTSLGTLLLKTHFIGVGGSWPDCSGPRANPENLPGSVLRALAEPAIRMRHFSGSASYAAFLSRAKIRNASKILIASP